MNYKVLFWLLIGGLVLWVAGDVVLAFLTGILEALEEAKQK